MSLLKAFELGVGSIVIIDDAYLPPDPDTVKGDALAELLTALKASPEDCATLGVLLNKPGANANALVDSAINDLQKLYDAYIGGQHPYLQPLFADLEDKQTADLRNVRLLEEEISKFFNVTPKKFADLENARADLSSCSIVFVDFFLEGVNSHEDARKLHSSVKAELAQKFACESETFPKVVVLMSSSLPPTTELAIFRRETGVKSAFFHTLDKCTFSSDELQSRLKSFVDSYESASQLNKYLETVESEITVAATALTEELRRLDLHDLTILKTLRLDGESDTPQTYLTLLLAEALAAKVRMAGPLQTEVLPPEHTYGDSPFDGKLLPSSVLFELFTDIAAVPVPSAGQLKIGFGDVLEATDGPDKGKLFLAISPACDLQRCKLTYEVLCVPGDIVEKNASLPALLEKNYQFGKGHLVLKSVTNNGLISFSRINFDVRLLKTFPVSLLQSEDKFRRMARLTEVFAQEVKTLALNHAARVGVPIDPSFSIGLRAKVRFNFAGDGKDQPKVEGDFDIDGSEFLPAVLAKGRELGATELCETVMFSSQFKAWLQKTLKEKLENQNSTKLRAVAEHFSKPDSFKVVLEKGGSKNYGAQISIRYTAQTPDVSSAQKFEIFVYPMSDDETNPKGSES